MRITHSKHHSMDGASHKTDKVRSIGYMMAARMPRCKQCTCIWWRFATWRAYTIYSMRAKVGSNGFRAHIDRAGRSRNAQVNYSRMIELNCTHIYIHIRVRSAARPIQIGRSEHCRRPSRDSAMQFDVQKGVEKNQANSPPNEWCAFFSEMCKAGLFHDALSVCVWLSKCIFGIRAKLSALIPNYSALFAANRDQKTIYTQTHTSARFGMPARTAADVRIWVILYVYAYKMCGTRGEEKSPVFPFSMHVVRTQNILTRAQRILCILCIVRHLGYDCGLLRKRVCGIWQSTFSAMQTRTQTHTYKIATKCL